MGALDTKQLLAGLTRLTGPPARKATHGYILRLKVVSKDGKECAISVGPVSDHRKDPSKATLNMVADRLRVERKEIVDVLATWSADDLIKHLRGLEAKEMKPPARGH